MFTMIFVKALDDGKEVRAVFCDISKAFDRVWHRGLLYKLPLWGLPVTCTNGLRHYLSFRKQRVVYANASSSWSTISLEFRKGLF